MTKILNFFASVFSSNIYFRHFLSPSLSLTGRIDGLTQMSLALFPMRIASSSVFQICASSLNMSTNRHITQSLPILRRFGTFPPPVKTFHRPRSMLDQIPHNAFSKSQIRSVRFQSTVSIPTSSHEPPPATEDQSPKPTRRIVAYHLFLCAAMVYLIIVVGGLTRLTESGLSITEWNPGFKGMRLPWTDAEWDAEWEKYKGTPEWSMYVALPPCKRTCLSL
jgi:hypothetical protein